MRTLAATFSTRDEAEAVSRRLEAIGISPERITQKEVETSGVAASAGAVFMSVKVTTDQVQAANEILKEHPAAPLAAAGAAAGADQPPSEAVAQPVAESVSPPQPAPAATIPPAATSARADAQPERRSNAQASRDESWGEFFRDGGRLRRYLVLLIAALAVAFLVGAGLGLLT